MMTDEQIDDLWFRRPSIHDGQLMPQLCDFARALLARQPAAIGKGAVTKKGDKREMNGRVWICTDPDIDRWVSCGPAHFDKDASKPAVTREEIEQARDRILEQSKNSLFRSGVKICAGEICSPTEQCDKPPEGWACSRIKGHEGPCAASPAAPSVAQDERGAFEEWMLAGEIDLTPNLKRDGEFYDDSDTEHAWRSWQARAASMVAARGETIRAITMLAGYADGSKSTELQNAVRQTVDWLNSQAVAKTSADDKDLPPIPTNAAHVTRRIRRCENEMAAQVVLEHFAREYARAASTSANVAQGAEAVAWRDVIKSYPAPDMTLAPPAQGKLP